MRNLSCLATIVAGLSLALLSAGVPARAQQGQGTPGADAAMKDKRVDLDLESVSLYDGLNALFKQVSATYSINEAAKKQIITVHLTKVPFHIALTVLLKSGDAPMTYRIEEGIYIVSPKADEPPPLDSKPDATPPATASAADRIHSIRIVNLSPIDIALALGGTTINLPVFAGTAVPGAPPAAGNSQNANPLLFDISGIASIFATNTSNKLWIRFKDGSQSTGRSTGQP